MAVTSVSEECAWLVRVVGVRIMNENGNTAQQRPGGRRHLCVLLLVELYPVATASFGKCMSHDRVTYTYVCY